MISKDRVYRTRDGREVRVYATDGAGLFNVHGAIKERCGWSPTMWANDGYWIQNRPTEPGNNDLIEVKPRIKLTVWLTIYDDYSVMTSMQKPTKFNRFAVACKEVPIDCEHGEGL